MIKLTTLVKRKKGLTPEAFKRYWYEKHTPLARKVIPEEVAPERYVHNYAITFGEAWEPAFDGIGSLCFGDVQRFVEWNEWFMSEEAEILHEDERQFVDSGTRVSVVVEEKVVVPKRRGAGKDRGSGKPRHEMKLMAMLKRKKGMTAEEFGRYWFEEHGPMAVRVIPEAVRVRRYVQNHALRLMGHGEPCFDGIVEFTLEDMESLEAWMSFYAGDGGKTIRDDEVSFIDMSEILIVMVEERMIRPMASKA